MAICVGRGAVLGNVEACLFFLCAPTPTPLSAAPAPALRFRFPMAIPVRANSDGSVKIKINTLLDRIGATDNEKAF